ncbi:MAG: hypothetical protein GY868_19775, partial [Deltaproteobacteria bacterium]|nr:hypothetical protein [Deltaproteobacteria bacterium]
AHLLALGKDGFAWAESSGDLEAAFKKVANDIRNKHQKYYILGYCSPKRKGEHEMTLKLKDYSGSLSFSFSADEFSGGCNPLDIIEP